MIKAFTAPKPPKPEEILLSDLKWIRDPQHTHIWICPQKHPDIKDDIFYVTRVHNKGSMIEQFFCNLTTWTNYQAQNYGHRVENSMQNVFSALYNVLTKDYYES